MRRTSPRALSAVVLTGLIAGSAATTAYAVPATGTVARPHALRQNSGPPGAVALRADCAPSDDLSAVTPLAARGAGSASCPAVAGDGADRERAAARRAAPGDPDGDAADGAVQGLGPDSSQDAPEDLSQDPILQDTLANDPARQGSAARDDPAGDAARAPAPPPSRTAAPATPAPATPAPATPAPATPAPATSAPATPAPAASDPAGGRPTRAPSRPPGRDDGDDAASQGHGSGRDCEDAGGRACAGSASQHGVQAGTGGSFTASLPALVGGFALIAVSLCGAAHRLWRRRGAADD